MAIKKINKYTNIYIYIYVYIIYIYIFNSKKPDLFKIDPFGVSGFHKVPRYLRYLPFSGWSFGSLHKLPEDPSVSYYSSFSAGNTCKLTTGVVQPTGFPWEDCIFTYMNG